MMHEVTIHDIRVFLHDTETKEAFEYFKGRERVSVDYDWFVNRGRQVGLVVSKTLLDTVKASLESPDFVRVLKTGLVELYRDYGLITTEQFALYRKTKDVSRIIPRANQAL